MNFPEKDNFSRVKFVTLHFDPSTDSVSPYFERRYSHASKSLHVLQSLHHNSAFEDKEHAKCKKTEVPVFIKEPESTAEDLEYEERGDQVLLVHIKEFWNWNIDLVLSPNE